MFKTDIIKTYILEPNYYEYENKNYYDILKIFNNNYILYINILIYNNTFCKTKQIKQNYIIIFYFNYYKNIIIIIKIKNYDNTKVDINTYYDYNISIYNFDLLIKKYQDTEREDIQLTIIQALIKFESHHVDLFLLECLFPKHFCKSRTLFVLYGLLKQKILFVLRT